MSILLYRNYFYPPGNANTALSHFSLLVVTSAIGYGTAALVTPGRHQAAAQVSLDRDAAGCGRHHDRPARRDVPAGPRS